MEAALDRLPKRQESQFDSWQSTRTTGRALRSISPQLHSTLLGHFWDNYNAVISVVDRDLFDECKELVDSPYYSAVLHSAMLAMGYRFADKSDNEVQKITVHDRESTFYHEAKSSMWCELQKPKVSTIAALLTLSDLEYGIGRSCLGWRYAGTCFLSLRQSSLYANCQKYTSLELTNWIY
jgi:hypothetical protein